MRALGHRWRARLARFDLHRLHLRKKGGWRGAWAEGVSRLCQTTLAHPIQARTGSHEPIVCSGSKAPRWPLVALGHKLGHCTLCRWPAGIPMGWWVCRVGLGTLTPSCLPLAGGADRSAPCGRASGAQARTRHHLYFFPFYILSPCPWEAEYLPFSHGTHDKCSTVWPILFPCFPAGHSKVHDGSISLPLPPSLLDVLVLAKRPRGHAVQLCEP